MNPACLFHLGPRLRSRIVMAAVVLLVAVAPAVRVQAQTAGIEMTVRLGFDGYYKETMWIPVRVTLSNDGPDVEGVIVVAAPRINNSTIDYTRPIELPSGSRKEVFMYVPIEGYGNDLEVKLVSGNTVHVKKSARLTQLGGSDVLYGVVAGTPSAFNILTRVDPVNGQARIAQLTIADLPPAAVAWRALDMLVISDVDTGLLGPEQQDAIRTWVAGGGHLVVTGGPGWQKVAAGLGDLLPVSPSGATTVSGLGALGMFARDSLPGDSVLATTGTLQPGADVLVSTQRNEPLIVERSIGYGQVDFIAFDPGLEPFRNWEGMEGVFRSLWALRNERPGWSGSYRSWYNAGEAINAIPGIGLPHVLQVCAFIGGYIVVIGPLNYLILRRLKRRELAWLTVPFLVLLFTTATYMASFGLRGSRATLHRLTVAQVWENSDRAQVETLIGIFSPRRAEYDLQVEGDLLLRPLPMDNYYARVDTSLDGANIEEADKVVVRNIRVDVGAIKPFVAQGQVSAPRFRSDLQYTVEAGSRPVLYGTIANLSDVDLHDAVVLAFSGHEAVGEVKAGAQVQVEIPLNALRATWTLQTPNQVAPPGAASTTFYPSGFSSGYDNTIEYILGTASYYDDRETFRRYSMLTWLFDPYSTGGRGSGTYLVGWADTSLVKAALVDEGFNTEDETLVIVSLTPQMVLDANKMVIPPGLMTWETIDPGTSGGGAPYESYLSQGYFAVRFRPFSGLSFTGIEALTLHLQSYQQTGSVPLNVSLWDHTEGVWVELKNIEWGDTPIDAPDRFVGEDGRIDARVENDSFQNAVNIERLDFTLTVQR